MAKSKISSQDFLDLLDDESDPQVAAFQPISTKRIASASTQEKDKLTVSLVESDSKRVANGEQIDSKRVAKTGSKEVANGEQSTTLKRETGSTTDSKENQNGWQTDSKQVANEVFFESLVGHERNLLLLIFRECSRIGSLISPELTLLHVTEALRCTPGTAKSAIVRLTEKGFVIRAKSKTGRGGWIKFGLTKELYQDLRIRESDSKEIANRKQTDSKQVAQRVAEQIADIPCSSSSLNKEKTTTTEQNGSVLESDNFWLVVPKNLEGLVSVKQLREFVRQDLISAEGLQSSLDGFALDLDRGAIKAKNGNPIAILIGAIKSGGYISQQYLIDLKNSLAENEKRRAEMQKIQEENNLEEIKAEFESFVAKFPEQAEKLKPKFINTFQPGSIGYRMWIEEYKRSKTITVNLVESK